jgi:hypothetical protein
LFGSLQRHEFERVVEGFHQRPGLEGLGEVMEKTRLEALDDGSGRGVGAEREDRCRLHGRIGAQQLHEIERAALGLEARQVDVDQDHVRPLAARQLDAEAHVRRVQQEQVLAAGEQLLQPRDVRGALFHIEQPATSRAGFRDGAGNHGRAVIFSRHRQARTVRWGT